MNVLLIFVLIQILVKPNVFDRLVSLYSNSTICLKLKSQLTEKDASIMITGKGQLRYFNKQILKNK